MFKRIKMLLKSIIFSFITILISSSSKIKPTSILLIRLDAIGDYVLFRNYIEELRKNEKYKNHSITLVGNIAWKSISEELDAEFVNKFIWLDRNKFTRNFLYRYKKLREITSQGYELVLSPVYSREFFYGDFLVHIVNAKQKIGSMGDLSNITKWQKNISDKYYDRLIDADSRVLFEFDRNKEFFENFLLDKIDLQSPHISLPSLILPYKLPDNYAVIFIGASKSYRKWDVMKFVQIASFLKDKYCYEIILCGGPSDKEDAEIFKNNCQFPFLDLVGKTTLMELLYVIDNGSLIVSNETSAPHFGITLGMKNVFVIYNGKHYGRFTPYPQNITENYHVIYHPEIESNLTSYEKLSNNYDFDSHLDINQIMIDSVRNKIASVLG
ncbi:glycosyltransferase family 9 protein [Psychromonas sp. PT13]|uniref:glycosyltransferase family 9 protein n=1 Tax=Psychromonas sp. PT13 TaxID=3439547 RepID=UPI003EBE8CFB